MTCIGGQIKAFSFLFCTSKDAKSTKGWTTLTYRVIAKQLGKREQAYPVCLRAVENDYETTSKQNE